MHSLQQTQLKKSDTLSTKLFGDQAGGILQGIILNNVNELYKETYKRREIYPHWLVGFSLLLYELFLDCYCYCSWPRHGVGMSRVPLLPHTNCKSLVLLEVWE